MSCPERTRYIAHANTLSGLEDLLDETLAEIRQHLSSAAQVKGVQEQLQLKRRFGDQVVKTLDHDTRIWILDKKTWNQVYGQSGHRGAYHQQGNKILLEEDRWCRKTIAHESLHSLSLFVDSRNLYWHGMFSPFAEGATEFLTGLLLFKAHRDCYENWRLMRFSQWCSASYLRATKTFLAFCGCVNVQSLLEFYFGTQTNDLTTALSSFIAAIRQDTGKNFRNIFGEGERIGLFIAFKNECERQFGKKFRKFQKVLDYNRVF